MRLMHVDASPRGAQSCSRALGRFFVDRLRERRPALAVDYLDLALDTPPHVSEQFAAATYTAPEQRSADMEAALARSDALCRRLLDADALLFAMPMYNWSMPSVFKAFIDAIVRAGLTYVRTEDGRFLGTLGGRKTLFVTTRGVDLRQGSPFAGMDALTPALRAAFGFIGVTDPDFVDAQPVQFAQPDERAAALEQAQQALHMLAGQWADDTRSSRGTGGPSRDDQPPARFLLGAGASSQLGTIELAPHV